MKFLYQYNTKTIILISLVSAIIIVYPNISYLPWELSYLDDSMKWGHIAFFIYRYLFFSLVAMVLLIINLRKTDTLVFSKRFSYNLITGAIAYGLYVSISISTCTKSDCFGSILLFQFFITCLLFSFFGHVYHMYNVQRRKDQEIEDLKFENLQSKCDALTNQINPHFFFNSLNSITALVRKKNDEVTLAFVNKLSDVFRYILQSEKKGLVPLSEELEFIEAFKFLMEVRFANKLVFNIQIPEDKMNFKLPALSLLPLIDNIVVHNVIDSENKMVVDITMTENDEVKITNPIYPKLSKPQTNGTGIRNVNKRFKILMNTKIHVKRSNDIFTVLLPLQKNK
nr:histidine kinase [uncultured Carboxylicivirga sp.]